VLCVDILVSASTQAEHRAARNLLSRARQRHIRPKTLGADKGYHVKDFVAHLRQQQIQPDDQTEHHDRRDIGGFCISLLGIQATVQPHGCIPPWQAEVQFFAVT